MWSVFKILIPICCFSCGKPVAHLWADYLEKTSKGESIKKVMDDLGLERYCCRGTLLGHADMLPEITKFKKA